MKISVIGAGYVGLVTGVCLARKLNNITCLDVDTNKIEKLKKGEPTIYENHLEEDLNYCLKNGSINFTSDYNDIADNDVYFIAVGTPPLPTGRNDLSYVIGAIDKIVSYKKETDDFIIVLKSTVEIGTGNTLKEKYKNYKNLKIVNSPEFLREGSAIFDFMNPNRVVIGTDNEDAAETIESIYKAVLEYPSRIEFVFTDNTSAEMIKYASNAFLATKISFINEIALLCDKVGANIKDVQNGMKYDDRIGSSFLNAGCGYGGSCFPKDVKALMYTGVANGFYMDIIKATESVNANMKHIMGYKVMEFTGPVKDKSYAVLGLAFKPDTDDVRESPAINNICLLATKGAKLYVYDPQAMENFKKSTEKYEWSKNVIYCEDEDDAISKAENGVIIITDWYDFRDINLDYVAENYKDKIVFDGRNMLYNKILPQGIKYIGVGLSK